MILADGTPVYRLYMAQTYFVMRAPCLCGVGTVRCGDRCDVSPEINASDRMDILQENPATCHNSRSQNGTFARGLAVYKDGDT